MTAQLVDTIQTTIQPHDPHVAAAIILHHHTVGAAPIGVGIATAAIVRLHAHLALAAAIIVLDDLLPLNTLRAAHGTVVAAAIAAIGLRPATLLALRLLAMFLATPVPLLGRDRSSDRQRSSAGGEHPFQHGKSPFEPSKRPKRGGVPPFSRGSSGLGSGLVLDPVVLQPPDGQQHQSGRHEVECRAADSGVAERFRAVGRLEGVGNAADQ